MTDGPTILCIEDDPASRQLVQRTLTAAGYNVLTAGRALEGMDLARQHHPDLILTDINLPDMSGHEITTSLRNDPNFANTPIVALTALGYGRNKDIAMAAGITGYLTKPFHIDELLERLAFYLGGGKDNVDDNERMYEAQAEYTREVVTRLETRIRQLEEANRELRRLDKMKESFIQITAHELRTPLTLVFGYSRLLEDYPPLKEMMQYDEGISTLTDGLVESISRMHEIIDEIMIVSRVMTRRIDLSIQQYNMGSLVKRVLDTYAEAFIERNQSLQFDIDEWPGDIRGDVDLMRVAIDNLISNAIKYTPDAGKITLEANADKHFVRFSIQDTGIGINPDDQKSIFDQFHTLEDVKLHSTSKTAFRGGGLGLGLAVTKGVIEAHGGAIKVESPKRDIKQLPGSRFEVMLPLKATPPLGRKS